MKRILSVLLTALLLLCPLLSTYADDAARINVPDGYLDADALTELESRAEKIALTYGVAVYYLYTDEDADAATLIGDCRSFAEERVSEENAVILSVNPSLYYFHTKGSRAEEIFPNGVCDGVLWEAYRALKSKYPNADNIGAYLDAADGVLREIGTDIVPTVSDPTAEPASLPAPPAGMALLKSGNAPVVDMAGLLRTDEAIALSEKLVSISDRYRCDVVIVTTDGLGGKTATEYADDFFDYNGYGYDAVPDENGTTINGDGILLLVSMADRDYWISTSGYGITAVTDYGREDLESRFLSDLSAGRYADSFDTFADRCAWLLDTARKGRPYDVGYRLNWFALIVAILAGFLFAFIPVSAMKRQLTDVHRNVNADRYLEAQSFALTQNSDVLLNTNVVRSVHVEPVRSDGGGGGHSGGSMTHTSSSGGTHGGGGGKF